MALPLKAPSKVVAFNLVKPVIVVGRIRVTSALPFTDVPVVPAVSEMLMLKLLKLTAMNSEPLLLRLLIV